MRGTAGEDAHPTRGTPSAASRAHSTVYSRKTVSETISKGCETISQSYEIISRVREAPSQYWPAISQTLET
ncbi:MAG: hypothetical protein ABI318_14575, partial [Chthoniobacteraceae bacterium]